MTKHRVVSLAIGIILLFAIPAISKSFLVPGDATTIQGAIDMAEDTDTVSVAAGTYSENIFMFDQNVSIIAVNGPEVTIIEPADPNSPLFTIYTSAPVRGSDNRIYSQAISGFTITGGGDSHVIYLDGQSQVTITGNIFHDNIPDKVYDKAVILCQGDSSAQVISHNIFYDNYGLCCVSVPNGYAQIIGNTFVGNRVAFLSSSETCVAINNIVTSCLNMGIDGAFGQNDYNLFWSNVLDYG